MLTAGLIVGNSTGSQPVETTDALGRMVGEAAPPRQLLSPSVAPQQVLETGSEEDVGAALVSEMLALSAEQDDDQTVVTTVVTAGAAAAAPETTVAAQQAAVEKPDAAASTTPQTTSTTAVATTPASKQSSSTKAPSTTARAQVTTTRAPTTQAPTTQTPTTQTPTTQTPTTIPPPIGRYTIAEVIDGTIAAGDGSNPNEESPMGRHDASLYLPQTWNWAQGPTRNSAWGNLGSGGSKYAEWRCAVIPENGHNPPVPFRINVSRGAYYQYAGGSWSKAFDVDLTNGQNGGYLGNAGRLNADPFSSGHHGGIQWRREADGSFSAPWNSKALMMHFWAGKRQAPKSGQTAEFLTSEVRLQQPDGQTVDLSRVKVLFQCGLDYYNTTGGQGTKVPGPGIAKYHRLTPGWTAGLWVTLPNGVDASSVSAFRTWLEANRPPNVGG